MKEVWNPVMFIDDMSISISMLSDEEEEEEEEDESKGFPPFLVKSAIVFQCVECLWKNFQIVL